MATILCVSIDCCHILLILEIFYKKWFCRAPMLVCFVGGVLCLGLLFFVFFNQFLLQIARNKFVACKLHDERGTTACERA